MAHAGVPFAIDVEADSPFDTAAGRQLLSLVRLALNEADSLAWRTLLGVRKNGIGPKSIGEIAIAAAQSGARFADALKVKAQSAPGPLQKEFGLLSSLLAAITALTGGPDDSYSNEEMQDRITKIAQALIDAGVNGVDEAADHLSKFATDSDAAKFAELMAAVSMAGLTPEQERMAGAVNMLTMHKAKGLTSRAVIIMACEDEYIPGRQQAVDEEADERRLLYVSLTRAREKLYITFAQKRFGQQQHTGRDSGKQRRKLTRYLSNAPVHAQPGGDFVAGLGQAR